MAERKLGRRQALMWGKYDFSRGHGLEIGPLHSTIAPREYADVRYLDVFDRDQLVANYADNPGVDCDLIPEVDYPLHDGVKVRSIPEAVGPNERFDWVMASHVIEHVPDLIGWLGQLAEITADGGDLVLAIPDRRYCFDLHRPGTSLGQLLQAHDLGETVPSVRAVYDYKRGHASVPAPDVWNGKPVGYEKRIYSLPVVREQVARARAGEYIDSHVWLFTPGSFLEQLIELRTLGLSEWKVQSLEPTRRDELEFYAILRRLPRDGDWPDALFDDEPEPPTMPDWLSEYVQLRADLHEARTETKAARRELRALRAETRALRKRNVALERRENSRLTTRVRNRLRGLPGWSILRDVRRRVTHATRRSR